MATQAQILANRENARKSTGPRTRQGKAAVSQNAVKHGLSARCDVIGTEDQAEFDTYRDEMLAEFAPVGPTESMLADRIVSLSWRLQRTGRIQNQVIDALHTHNGNPSPLAKLAQSFIPRDLASPEPDPADPPRDLSLGRMAIRDFSNARVLDRLLMYERRTEHSLYKTMLELQRLRLIRTLPSPEKGSGAFSESRHLPQEAPVSDRDSLEEDSLERHSPEKNALRRNSLEKDSLENNSLERIPPEGDSLLKNSADAAMVRPYGRYPTNTLQIAPEPRKPSQNPIPDPTQMASSKLKTENPCPPAPSTTVEDPLQIRPSCAKQTQFRKTAMAPNCMPQQGLRTTSSKPTDPKQTQSNPILREGSQNENEHEASLPRRSGLSREPL